MPTSLVSTGVQFPDSTTQTTALPAPGTAGNVLTSTGSAWSSSAPGATGLYQGPTVYDRQVTFAGDLWATASNGSVRIQAIQLTATTELLLFYGNGGSGIYAVVWDNSAKTFGSSVLVDSVNMGNVASVDNVAAVQVTTNTVLVGWQTTSSVTFTAKVLSVSGTTITVGASATSSSSVFPAFINSGGGSSFRVGFNRFIQSGSSFVLLYTDSNSATAVFARAITVSGTTATVGAEVTVRSISSSSFGPIAVNVSSGVICVITNDSSPQNLFYNFINVSGTTITAGNSGSLASGNLGGGSTGLGVGVLSTGRVFVAYNASGSKASIISTSGTVNTITLSYGFTSTTTTQIVNDKIILYSNFNCYLLRDNAGTLVEDNRIDILGSASHICYFDGTNVYLSSSTSGPGNPMYAISISGTSLSVDALYASPVGNTSQPAAYRWAMNGYSTNYSGVDYGGVAAISGIFWTSTNTVAQVGFSNADLYNVCLVAPTAANGRLVPYENPTISTGSMSATRSALTNAAGFVIGYTTGQSNNVSRRRLQVRRFEVT